MVADGLPRCGLGFRVNATATMEHLMQHISQADFALSLADNMIKARFAREYGVSTFAEYLDFVDRRSTAHLNEHMARKVKLSAGAQRRRTRLSIEDAITLIIAVPMNNPRTGEMVWAMLEFSRWLDLMEIGLDTAWFFAYKQTNQAAGQVRALAPLSGRTSATNATIARVIANAKTGQQARVQDRNPLNLRQSNIYLLGRPGSVEGAKGRAKTDTLAHVLQQRDVRAALAGRDFGIPDQDKGAD